MVDASVFPRIPGFFIASAVYMIGEKAADVILAQSREPRGRLRQPSASQETTTMAYDVQQLLKMSQAELDTLFTASPAGPIPERRGRRHRDHCAGTTYSPSLASFISNFAWQGKVFDGEKGVLRNRILPFGLNAIIAKVYKGDSWLDGKECIVLDYSDTSLLAQWIRDEIREIQPGMYLGKVYWGKQRLIDFVLEFKPAA